MGKIEAVVFCAVGEKVPCATLWHKMPFCLSRYNRVLFRLVPDFILSRLSVFLFRISALLFVNTNAESVLN
jgi:hypothetical protein